MKVFTAAKSYMNSKILIETAKKLVANDKGLLAIDESNSTCNKRFATVGIPQTVDTRRAYRELIEVDPVDWTRGSGELVMTGLG